MPCIRSARLRLISGLLITITLYVVVTDTFARKYPSNYVKDWNSPRITLKEIKRCPKADGFDFPVGKPNAKGYYNAQGFTRNNHLADDWNGVRGGNSDLGDPIYAIANGIVVHAKNHHGPWGRVTRILHNAGTHKKPVYVESLYGHMRTILVKRGTIVKRGQKIGTIGNANGTWWAHLHLEIRTTINKSLGVGYSTDTTGYVNPTAYIKRHRPYWQTASYKRRMAKRAALRKQRRKERALARKNRNNIAFISSKGTVHAVVTSMFNSIENISEHILEANRSEPETILSNIEIAITIGISACESTGLSDVRETDNAMRTIIVVGTFWGPKLFSPSQPKKKYFYINLSGQKLRFRYY